MPELLPIPFRKTIPIDLSKQLSNFIESNHLSAFCNIPFKDIDRAHQTRKRLLKLDISFDDLQNLILYYAMVQKLAYIFEGSNSDIEFTWIETLSFKAKSMVSTSFKFEEQNILYNIGCMYSLLGVENFCKSDSKSIVQSCKLFQQAATCFQGVLSSLGEQEDRNTLESILTLMKAQAQEMFWLKAVRDGKLGNKTVARLAKQTSDYYLAASESSKKSNIMTSQWEALLAGKHYYFEAVSLYRLSLTLEGTLEGMKLLCLKDCFKLIMNIATEQANGDHDIHVFKEFIDEQIKITQREYDFFGAKQATFEVQKPEPFSLVKFVDMDHSAEGDQFLQNAIPFKMIAKAQSFNIMEKEYIAVQLVEVVQRLLDQLIVHLPQGFTNSVNLDPPIALRDYESVEKNLLEYLPNRRQELESVLKSLLQTANVSGNLQKQTECSTLLEYLQQGANVDTTNIQNFGHINKNLITNHLNISFSSDPIILQVENNIESRKMKLAELQKIEPGFFNYFISLNGNAKNENLEDEYAKFLRLTYKSYTAMIQSWTRTNELLISKLKQLSFENAFQLSVENYTVLNQYKTQQANFLKIKEQVNNGLKFYDSLESRIQSS
ncbi:hypothetical protein ACO0RG_002948 [Hanseniaspora osmophila]